MTGAAWALHLFGRTLPDWAAALAVAVLAAAMAIGLARRGYIARAAFIRAWLIPASRLARWARGRWWIGLRSALLAAVLAPLLFTALLRAREPVVWTVLVGAAPLLALVLAWLTRRLEGHVNAEYLPVVAWRLGAGAVGVAMLAALVTAAFHRAYPDLGGVGLERAVWHFVDQERARSGFVDILLKLAAAKDALRLWLAQQLMPQPGGSLAQAAGWAIVLAEEALFVWSYLLWLCPAVLPRVSRRVHA